MCDAPILYSFRRCPYAMRARMALQASGTPYVHREIVLRDKPRAMLDVSLKGTVPVLVLPGGAVIDESIDIMHWGLAQHDPENWLARHDEALVAEFDGPFKHHLDRYKYAERYDVDPFVHCAAGLAILADLGARLTRRKYLGGTKRGFTDVAIFPFVRQFAAVDADWFGEHASPSLRDWLWSLVTSALFERAMVRFPTWVQDQDGADEDLMPTSASR